MDLVGSVLSALGVDDFMALIGTILMKVVTALFIILAALLYIGQFIYTQVAVKIALMVMPIMVPFIMLESTRFIFTGWVKFLLTAGMAKVVGAIMFSLLESNITHALTLSERAAAQDNGNAIDFYVYSTLLLVTGLTAYIMLQTQSIATGLLSGSLHGGFRFGTVSWANSVSRGAGQAAKGAAGVVNSAGGAVNGARSAQSGFGARMQGGVQGAREGLMAQLARPTKTPPQPSSGAAQNPTTSTPRPTPSQQIRQKIADRANTSGRKG